MAKLFVNSGDPDQTAHSAASDLGLHCLPNTLLRVSRLQWVNWSYEFMINHQPVQVKNQYQSMKLLMFLYKYDTLSKSFHIYIG